MQRILLSIGLILALALSATTTAQTAPPTGGLPPWHFGMSAQEVISQLDAGPYKSFTNGDLETYNGLFDGHNANVQFFFKEEKLVRIGVYLYEGEDIKPLRRFGRRPAASLRVVIETGGARNSSCFG